MKKTKKPITDKIIKKITKTKTKIKTKKVSLKDVVTAIEKWSRDNDVTFVGSFISFDKDDCNDCKECEMVAFGQKEEIKIHMESLSEMLDEEKDDFVNW